jgi:hypothetical protein
MANRGEAQGEALDKPSRWRLARGGREWNLSHESGRNGEQLTRSPCMHEERIARDVGGWQGQLDGVTSVLRLQCLSSLRESRVRILRIGVSCNTVRRGRAAGVGALARYNAPRRYFASMDRWRRVPRMAPALWWHASETWGSMRRTACVVRRGVLPACGSPSDVALLDCKREGTLNRRKGCLRRHPQVKQAFIHHAAKAERDAEFEMSSCRV